MPLHPTKNVAFWKYKDRPMKLPNWISKLTTSEKRSDLSNYQLIGNETSYAGTRVDEESVMRYGAVYACVRIIAESIASLPLVLIRQNGRNKERATNHPLYTVLHDMANPQQTAFEWRELMFQHVLTWGNGWSQIETNARGEVIALWPLSPNKVEGFSTNSAGTLGIHYREKSDKLTFVPYWMVHHIKGPGNGFMGVSPIRLAIKQAAGLGLATEEFGSRFFSNGARPGMILKHPGHLSDKAYTRLLESMVEGHQGLSNSHRTKILEEGMDLTTIGIPPNEAQFLETRKFQVQEIARIYRVPLHMLADLDRATFSNIEHQSLNFVQHTLLSWLVRHEQAIYRDLLFNERGKLDPKYIVSGLLRGDAATRHQSYMTGINTGYLTRNEARELEDMNPIEGLDEPLIPLNMIEVGAQPITQPGTSGEPTEEPVRSDRPDLENENNYLLNKVEGLVRELKEFDEENLGLKNKIKEFENETNTKITKAINDFRMGLEAQLKIPFGEIFKEFEKLKEERAANTATSRRRQMNQHLELFEDSATRVLNRELVEIRKAIKRFLDKGDVEGFRNWLMAFYEELRGKIPDYYLALMKSYSKVMMQSVADELKQAEPEPLDQDMIDWINGYLEIFAEVYTNLNNGRMIELVDEEDADAEKIKSNVEKRLEDWEETKAQTTALRQVFEAGNALVVLGFIRGGVETLQWSATGKSCPYCKSMDGRKIKVGQFYFDKDEELKVEGQEPFLISRKISHGPLHGGCDCVTVAG
jgi:HK97 family phage portal protein